MTVPQELEALAYADYLQLFDGEFADGGDYREVHLDEGVYAGVDAGNVRFIESAVTGVTFEDGGFPRVRLHDVWLSRTRWVGFGWVEGDLLDVAFLDGVLAGVQAYGATVRRTVFERCKLNGVNLRGATLRDVEFRDCDLSEVDFGGAVLSKVTFPGSAVRRGRFEKATMTEVDLRGARELDVAEGADALRGAVVSARQLVELAPALARALGLTVVD